MHHELLAQRALFCIGVDAKKGTLSQHFFMHVVPPLCSLEYTPHKDRHFRLECSGWLYTWV